MLLASKSIPGIARPYLSVVLQRHVRPGELRLSSKSLLVTQNVILIRTHTEHFDTLLQFYRTHYQLKKEDFGRWRHLNLS